MAGYAFRLRKASAHRSAPTRPTVLKPCHVRRSENPEPTRLQVVAGTKRDLPCTTQSCAGSSGTFSHRYAKATLNLVSMVWPLASTMSFRARTLSAARVTRRPACADGSRGFSFFSRSLILRSNTSPSAGRLGTPALWSSGKTLRRLLTACLISTTAPTSYDCVGEKS